MEVVTIIPPGTPPDTLVRESLQEMAKQFPGIFKEIKGPTRFEALVVFPNSTGSSYEICLRSSLHGNELNLS